MMYQPERPSAVFRALHGLLFLLLASARSLGLDGGNSVFITVPTGNPLGWKTFEIISGNDTLGAVAKEGFVWTSKHDDWDGLGAYLHDDSTLRVFVNHEAGADSTFSRVDLNLANLESWIASGIIDNTNTNQVAPPGQVVKAVSRGWLTLGSGTDPINNPCSGNVWPADTFGAGRGFADQLYLTGEETFNNSGQFWVMDVATRTVYEAPDLGGGSWESATPIDTGRTDTVALVLSDDSGAGAGGTSPLFLYVGAKNPGGNFLQRNGLSGGTVYYWDPNLTASTNGTMSGIFSGGNGTVVPGTWVASSTGAALFSKSEDVHTNVQPSSPGYGVEVALASQGEAVFKVDFSQVDFVAGDLGTNRDSDILVLFEAGTQAVTNDFSGMDNLVWSTDGFLYVNEDDGEGDIWRIDVASLEASYAASDFTPDATQVFDVLDADFVGESSGIIEISDHVGYQPGGVFLTSGQSSTLANNQMALLVAPGAALKVYSLSYIAGPGGFVAGPTSQMVNHGGDGATVIAIPGAGFTFAGWSDGVMAASRLDLDVREDITVTANFAATSGYSDWISGFPGIFGPDANPAADPDSDGLRNDVEYACNLDPSFPDNGVLVGGTGTAGLPLVEVRTFGPAQRLVVEYIRRVGDPGVTYLPEFGNDLLSAGWGPGAPESTFPVDLHYERVIVEDTVDVAGASERFARMRILTDLSP